MDFNQKAPPKRNIKIKNQTIGVNITKNHENNSTLKILLNDDLKNKKQFRKKTKNYGTNIIIIKNKNMNIKRKRSENKINKNSIFNQNKKNSYNNKEQKKELKNQSTKYSLNKKIKFNYSEKRIHVTDSIYINLNDQELNSLDYEKALKLDKRTYMQYYWSLLKKKQLILFTFCLSNDYNLISVKLTLFLISFSLYFTITSFFFDDVTMHHIYIEHINYNIINQIPKILLSSLISTIINIILKELSLSEKNFLSLKRNTNINIIKENSLKMKSFLKIKLTIFFILSNLFLIIFLYFISCFCAAFQNTQIILIKETLISFSVSLLYPFGLYLLPGMFRIPALRAKNKNKKCLYKLGGIISLI